MVAQIAGTAATLLWSAALWHVGRWAARPRLLGAAPWTLFVIVAAGTRVLELPAVASACIGALVVCAVVDARTGYLYDKVTIFAFAGLTALRLLAGSAPDGAAGALACGGALGAVYLVTRGRGLGLGDVKLGAVIGAGAGASLGIVAIGAAFVCGAAAAVTLITRRLARPGDRVAFGPWLAAGTCLVLAYHRINGGFSL